jgi:hypothetical protein
MIEFWFNNYLTNKKNLIMKRSVRPFMAFAFLLFSITLIHGVGCSKKNDNDECRTCKAIGFDTIEDEDVVCSEAEETAFRNANPGLEIVCD